MSRRRVPATGRVPRGRQARALYALQALDGAAPFSLTETGVPDAPIDFQGRRFAAGVPLLHLSGEWRAAPTHSLAAPVAPSTRC